MIKVGDVFMRRRGTPRGGKLARVISIRCTRVHLMYLGGGALLASTRRSAFDQHWHRPEEPAAVSTGPTAGHCAGNGGLRGHSVGDVFPVVPYMRGTPHETDGLTYWLRLPDGRDIGPYYNADDQHRAAAWYKEQM